MVDVEIFGGKNDGQIINVSETVARSGHIRIPNFKVRPFVATSENEIPPLPYDDIEIWKIVKFVTPTGGLRVKAIESGMWARINR